MEPSVAFLVPVHQARATIAGCLDSMLGQTVGDVEVVVVDDASTDGSAEVVRRYAQADHRVRLLTNPTNRGVAHSLNVGLRATTATYVARLDADDEARSDRVERQLQVMEGSSGIGVCGSDVTYIGREPGRDLPAPPVPTGDAEIRAELAGTTRSPFHHPSVMLRRDLVLAVGGYREYFRNAEDYDLWLRLAPHCSFANIPLPLTRYRVSPLGASLARAVEQHRYAMLAKASAEQPGASLEDLWTELAARPDDGVTRASVRRQHQHAAALLADLGYPRQALGLLLRARADIGWAPALRFLPGRVRRRLG